MLSIITAMLLTQALSAAPAEPLLACLRSTTTPEEMTATATSMLDARPDERPSMPAFGRMLRQCGDRTLDGSMPVMLGFGIMVTAEQRAITATRAGLTPEQRATFEAVLQPVADSLEVSRDGRRFGPTDISDATLATIRRDVAAAGIALDMSDDGLRMHIERMSRDRTMNVNLNRIMAARQ